MYEQKICIVASKALIDMMPKNKRIKNNKIYTRLEYWSSTSQASTLPTKVLWKTW
jgi:hypothetical protein